MADSVFKLTVDSKEYDSKIARAAQGLAQFEKKCREVGGTLEYVEKEDLDFVKALGQMQTVANSASSKLAELKKAFVELSVQYKNLTDAEKNSPYGKALAGSLDQLKGRIKGLEGDLKGAQGELVGVGDALGQLAGKIGIPTQLLTKMGLAVGAVGVALKVSKDAFFASESNIDDWGRTVEAAQTVYEGFLTSLNTGDISGFLSRIGQIVQSANEAYTALDRLSTQKAINNAAYQRQIVENERNRAMLRTGRYIAPNDGSAATMADGAILTDAQKKQIADELQSGIKKLNQIVQDEINSTTEAINKLYTQQASVLGMSTEEFKKGTASMAEFEERLRGYALYLQYEKDHTYTPQAVSSYQVVKPVRDASVNPYESYRAWGVFKDDGDLFARINDLINQRSALQMQNYSQQAQAYRSINTATGVSARGGGGAAAAKPAEVVYPSELGTGAPGLSMFEQLQQSIRIKLADQNFEVDQNSLTNLLSVAMQYGIDSLNPDFERVQYMMAEGFDIPEETWVKIQDEINAALGEMNIDPIKIDVKTGSIEAATGDVKKLSTEWVGAAQAIAQFGSALQSVEDPTAKIAGIIAQAIASVAAGAGSAIAQAGNGSAGGPWGWVAFAISATATMISTIAAIKSATSNAPGFAEGGIVGGNSYSGDRIIARLNSGEGVLTQKGISNAANMAAALDAGGAGAPSNPFVTGETIVLGINNFLGRSGQGEIVTTSMLRRAGVKL